MSGRNSNEFRYGKERKSSSSTYNNRGDIIQKGKKQITYRRARRSPSYDKLRYREARKSPIPFSDFSSFGSHSTGFNIDSSQKVDTGSHNQSSFTQLRRPASMNYDQNCDSPWQTDSFTQIRQQTSLNFDQNIVCPWQKDSFNLLKQQKSTNYDQNSDSPWLKDSFTPFQKSTNYDQNSDSPWLKDSFTPFLLADDINAEKNSYSHNNFDGCSNNSNNFTTSRDKRIYTHIDKGTEFVFGDRNDAFGNKQQFFASERLHSRQPTLLNQQYNRGLSFNDEISHHCISSSLEKQALFHDQSYNNQHDRYEHLSKVAEKPFRVSDEFDTQSSFKKNQDYERQHLRFTKRSSRVPEELDRQSYFKDQSQNYHNYVDQHLPRFTKTHSPISRDSDRQTALSKYESKNNWQSSRRQPSKVSGSLSLHENRKNHFLSRKNNNSQYSQESERFDTNNKRKREGPEIWLEIPNSKPTKTQQRSWGKAMKMRRLQSKNFSEPAKKTPFFQNLNKFQSSQSKLHRRYPSKNEIKKETSSPRKQLIKSTHENQKQSSKGTVTSDTTIQSKVASIQPSTELSESEILEVLSDQESRRESGSTTYPVKKKHFTQEEIRDLIKQRKVRKRRIIENARANRQLYQKLGFSPQFNKKKKKVPQLNNFVKCIIMAVMKNNFPFEEFTEEEIPGIRKLIMDEIASTSEGQTLPKIENTIYFFGALLVYCKDRDTVEWLKSKFHSKPIVLPECTLKVTLASEMPRSTKIGVKTNDITTTDPEAFLKRIDQLNPGYKARTWRFKDRHEHFLLKKCISTLWLFEIDDDIIDIIKEKKRFVYTGVEKTTIRIYKSNFKIFDTQ